MTVHKIKPVGLADHEHCQTCGRPLVKVFLGIVGRVAFYRHRPRGQ